MKKTLEGALGGALPGFADAAWLDDKKPNARRAWHVVGLWRREFDGNDGIFERLAETLEAFGDRVSVSTLSPSAIDELQGSLDELGANEGLRHGVVSEQDFRALDVFDRRAGHAVILDKQLTLRWIGNVTYVQPVLERLLDGTLSDKQLDALAKLTLDVLTLGARFEDARTALASRKDELREGVLALREHFSEDEYLEGLLGALAQPDVGEIAPSLGKPAWVSRRKGPMKGLRLLEVCNHFMLEEIPLLATFDAIQQRHGEKLSVMVLDANEKSAVKSWLDEHPTASVAVGVADEALAQRFFPPALGIVGERAFLLAPSDKILWHGSGEAAAAIVAHVIDRGATEETLREHCIARDAFFTFAGAHDPDADTPLEDEPFAAFERLARRVLDFNPHEYEVLSLVLRFASRRGAADAERWARALDVATVSDRRLELLCIETEGSALTESSVRWAYERVRRDRKDALRWRRYAESAQRAGLLELAMDARTRAAAIDPSEDADGLLELENMVEGQRAAARLFSRGAEA